MSARVFVIILSLALVGCGENTTESTDTDKVIHIDSPAGANSSLPHLTVGGDGKLYLSWIDSPDSIITKMKYSMFDGDKWMREELIASGTDWFVNWADYPTIAVDKKGNMIAHYLAKSDAATFSYDINVVVKPYGGNWSKPILPHTDSTLTEHGFVTMLSNNDDTFLLAWLDGRNTGGGHGTKGSMTLRSASINLEGELTEEVELDSRVCDCCQTGGVQSNSSPLIVYRDRSDDEIRDINFIQKINNKWMIPARVNQDDWKIEGCPVNGPRIASFGKSTAVAWFTAAVKTEVRLAFRESSADDFDDPILIDDSDPIGRVDVIMLDEVNAAISWLDSGNEPAIKYQQVSNEGIKGDPIIISTTSPSRGSGFPQMDIFNESPYFAWTSLNQDGSTTISMAKIE